MKREMNKKAQVAIFIVIAIFLVAGGVITFYMIKNANKNSQTKDFFSGAEAKPELDNVKSFTLSCIDESTKQSLETIGIQGGYFVKPKESLDLGWAFIPYYYNQREFLMPDIYQVQSELGKAVNKNINTCIDKLKISDGKINYKDAKTTAKIQKGRVDFEIDMPLTITKGDSTMTVQLKDLPVSYNSSLFDILEVASYITESHKGNPNMICVTCIAKMAEERNLYVDMFTIPSSSVLVVISENYTSSIPYSYEFLNRYGERTEIMAPPKPASGGI